MEKLNTHYYDGKLPLIETCDFTERCYFDILGEMERYVNEGYKGKYNKKVIVSSIGILRNSKKTFDNKDKIDARHLIVDMWSRINVEEMWKGEYDYFYEQIHDIVASGSCPQGVVKRVYQIYQCLI